MASGPTYIFVPGNGHVGSHFGLVVASLASQGYKSIALSLPANNGVKAVDNIDADVGVIRKAIVRELDEGRDVVVIMHSFTLWGCEALKGLYDDGKGSIEQRAGKGQVKRLVFMAGAVLIEGMDTFNDLLGGTYPPSFAIEVCIDDPVLKIATFTNDFEV